MIAIIDYGMGNVRSVYNAVYYIGEDAVITSDAKEIDNASHIILPGVGAFGDAVKNLKGKNLVDILRQQVFEIGKPFLGICLGLQVLAKSSEEHGNYKGLGWFDAVVKRFNLKGTGLKVPHVGWNEIKPQTNHSFFNNLKKDRNDFYFVHSLHVICRQSENVAATCEYGDYVFTAAIQKDNIIATQFHPEKSQDNGIQVLQNFLDWNP